MKISLYATLAALALATPALAEGDVAAGEKEFTKCKTCHSITAPDGTDIVKGGKIGPNLYGVIGRQAGTYPDFKYKDSIVALGESGFVWTEEEIATYMTDPTKFLKEKLDDKKAKSGMTHKQSKKQEDIVAYLASVVAE
ncbi:cytochrome c [Rhodobacter aestuarii]|uniref:Cytochrome c n=1 Tax=Rhodobacter aestuarii TaxID=453582 RepID=A0A1N7L1Q7_9RHOB|nr:MULTISPECIES: c-type cytochrome [Rhodobacter]PTV95436.1 cytochrome c [Rhodobacter aestuarii]SIS67792.1 cytochrome c [Rhodobacter aestuarii]SOB90186.1 cytochrome c [Rhodobacter sp. JA431]